MDPINYQLSGSTPVQSLAQGYQLGAGIRNDQQQQVQQAQQQQAQQQSSAAIHAYLEAPSVDTFSRAQLLAPQLSKQLSDAWQSKTADQQKTLLSDWTGWTTAAVNGQPAIAAAQMRQKADAIENTAGAPTAQSQALRTQANLMEAHPEYAGLVGLNTLSAQGKDGADIAKQILLNQKSGPEIRKLTADATTAEAEAANAPEKLALGNAETQSQIDTRAAQLGIDKDKLTSDLQFKLAELGQKQGQLPAEAQKIVNDGALGAVTADAAAAKTNDLANRIESLNISGGSAFAGPNEFFKRAFGGQDELTSARQEYLRLRQTAIKSVLPPGPASDRDVSLALKGFPPETASKEDIVSFLRGMSKLQNYESAYNTAQSEWAGAVGSLGKAKKDIEVDGVKVPAGTSFIDFSKHYLARKVKEKNDADESVSLVNHYNSLNDKYAPTQAAPAMPTAAPLLPGQD